MSEQGNFCVWAENKWIHRNSVVEEQMWNRWNVCLENELFWCNVWKSWNLWKFGSIGDTNFTAQNWDFCFLLTAVNETSEIGCKSFTSYWFEEKDHIWMFGAKVANQFSWGFHVHDMIHVCLIYLVFMSFVRIGI